MDSIAQAISQIAARRISAGDPCDITYGTVSSVSPLKVDLNEKQILTDDALELSTLVSDFDVYLTSREESETAKCQGCNSSGHKHDYGYKRWTVHLGLSVGEKVVLVRMSGGQKYIILDRVRS